MYFNKFIYCTNSEFSKDEQRYIFNLVLRYVEQEEKVFNLLKEIKKYNQKNYDKLVDLFWEQHDILEELTSDEEVYY